MIIVDGGFAQTGCHSSFANMEALTGSVTLLRGVALSDILWRGGKLFQNSTGSARTYRLSVPVDHLESFISHTWNTPRWKKHLALSCEFNFARALAVSFLVGVVITLLCALKLLPLADIVYLDGVEMPGAPYCTFTVPVVFHVLLSGGCHPVFRFSKPRFFVDKACIHQDGRGFEATWDREFVHVHFLLVGPGHLVFQKLSAEAVDGVRTGEFLDTAPSGQDTDVEA